MGHLCCDEGVTPVPETAPSPTLARRMLVASLQRLHKEHGLSTDRIGNQMGVGGSTVARWLSGQKMNLRPHDVRGLMAAWGYEPGDQITTQLVQLAQDAKQRGISQRKDWSTVYRFDLFVELEAAAVEILNYEPTLLPGLLQTARYAETVIREEIHDEAGIAERVQLRMDRQRILLRSDHPARLHAVIDESVVRRLPADPEVGREQLQHLIDVIQLPNVTVQIIPFTSGPLPTGSNGPFVILQFPQVERVAYQETPGIATYLETADETSQYLRVMRRLAERALEPAASAEMITAALNNL
jgi:transcriptional regulator with XRE-family HTH domain